MVGFLRYFEGFEENRTCWISVDISKASRKREHNPYLLWFWRLRKKRTSRVSFLFLKASRKREHRIFRFAFWNHISSWVERKREMVGKSLRRGRRPFIYPPTTNAPITWPTLPSQTNQSPPSIPPGHSLPLLPPVNPKSTPPPPPTLPSNSPLQRLLLLRLNLNLLNKQPLPPPHTVHIPLRHILSIRQLTQILQLIFRKRNPEGIFIQHLEAREAELRTSRARTALSDLVAEAERFRHREKRGDGEGLVPRRGRGGAWHGLW